MLTDENCGRAMMLTGGPFPCAVKVLARVDAWGRKRYSVRPLGQPWTTPANVDADRLRPLEPREWGPANAAEGAARLDARIDAPTERGPYDGAPAYARGIESAPRPDVNRHGLGESVADGIRSEIHRLLRSGDRRDLLNALDCDAYTVEGDLRALEGLGWTPCELRPEERRAIGERLTALEEA